jgi:hypothetical protein
MKVVSGTPVVSEFRSFQLTLPVTTAGSDGEKFTVELAEAAFAPAPVSAGVELTVAVFWMGVADGVCRSTLTTSVKVCDPSAGVRVGRVHVTVPPEDPTTGRGEQVHPAGELRETKVVCAGMGSDSTTD